MIEYYYDFFISMIYLKLRSDLYKIYISNIHMHNHNFLLHYT